MIGHSDLMEMEITHSWRPSGYFFYLAFLLKYLLIKINSWTPSSAHKIDSFVALLSQMTFIFLLCFFGGV